MDSGYDTKQWAAKTDLGQRLFIYNFNMFGNEFSGWELVNSVITEIEPSVSQKIYIWKKTKAKDEQLVHVSIVERSYWQHAQLQLKNELKHCMRPDLPKGKGKTASLGDVRYIGDLPDSNQVAAVFFSRGNLQITIRSVGQSTVDVVKFAKAMDGRFVKPPTKAEEKSGFAKKIKPAKITAKKEVKTVVVDKLSKSVPRSGWLRAMSDDGELRRDDDTLNCIYQKGGKKEIELIQFGKE